MSRCSLSWRAGFCALVLLIVMPAEGNGDRAVETISQETRAAPAERTARAVVRPADDDDDERWRDPVTEAGQHARGLYFGARFVRRNGVEGVIREVRNARMNAVVLDLKDSEGKIHHDTRIETLRPYRTGWLGDTRALVRALRDADLYTIARITCFADRSLAVDAPERSIRHIRHGRPWVSWGTGGTWLDPYNRDNQRLMVELSREAQALGFDEVQLDYVRFPVDDGTQYAHYPAETDEPRPDVLMRMLRDIDEALTIPLGVDVFGLAAYRRGDPSGLGQDLERWTRHVEVYSPMLYVNSMRHWRRGEPNRAYTLIHDGVNTLRQRIGPTPVIRPFLQAFSQGADDFGTEFIAKQIRGARNGNADGFLFWHPGHTYGTVRRTMHRTRSLVPFPIPEAVVESRRAPSRRPTGSR